MKPKISAVVLTLNEERNLAKALRSVQRWVDDIVVVDMNSEDNTAGVAKSFGARVFAYPRVGFVEPAREFAMCKATGEWIINLDADEIAPHALSRRLLEVAEGNLADVCAIPRLNYFSGAPLYHSGWSPDQDIQMRFFRNGYLEFSPSIHTLPKPVRHARVLTLKSESSHYIVHFNYLDSEHFLQKLNRYTSIEAEQARERGTKSSLGGFIIPSLKEFVVRYIIRQGFRDGWRGFYYSALMGTYRMAINAKLRELEGGCQGSSCSRRYDEIAEGYLSEYEPNKQEALCRDQS